MGRHAREGEQDADRAEQALKDDADGALDLAPWIPPEMHDALPAHLVPRATALARRQEALIVALEERASHARREDRALGRWHSPTHRPAVYLDQSV
ncbi:hypothetical protein [Demequina litorisediminis]|uniref:Uncharacterized protein n=1 Tax=Demequina litorisediminis TaxID=1849022 RepID=A0ABQ6IEX5_9MICO|nr:hypothetical protein [Demequina litorisediminis]GMA35668.1 hypothetical protein GCM10025876_18720 [Demequina litorisediminis]